MATETPVLSVADLVVRFHSHEGTVHAVNGVSFDLGEGESIGLVGESGCGKSVTSLAIMRLLPKPAGRLVRGSIKFDGQDLVELPDAEMRALRGKDLAMIFQDPMTSLNPVLTIEEQMVETIRAHGRATPEEARKRAVQLLEMVGMARPETRLKNHPHQFSGGMRQRVMIAMALALEPRVLIADEPTTALDVTIQAQVLDLLRNLVAKNRTSVILITHDLGVVAGMTERVNVMYAGFVVETGTTAALFDEPSHPYTVGLLHSVPRLDEERPAALIPIEGGPPDQRQEPVGCPFAPRCAWRLPICWEEMPPLAPIGDAIVIQTTGPGATHMTACHNPPTRAEAAAGRPLRVEFVPAPPPSQRAQMFPDDTPAAAEAIGGLDPQAAAEIGLPIPPENEPR